MELDKMASPTYLREQWTQVDEGKEVEVLHLHHDHNFIETFSIVLYHSTSKLTQNLQTTLNNPHNTVETHHCTKSTFLQGITETDIYLID